jgi:5-dehydro-2-deoxygluconokinase
MSPIDTRGSSAASQLNLDVLTMGSLFVELTPEQPGQPLAEMQRLVPLAAGAAANFALALAALGPRVGMLSRLGDDELGQWLRRQMEGHGIDMTAVSSTPN